MSLLFGHMFNLILKLFSCLLLLVTFILSLKNVHAVNDVNRWTNDPLMMLMCCPYVANFVEV